MKDLALDLGGSLIVATYGFIKHDEILENLTLEKYNLIFDTLINDQDLERIKEIISRD